LNEAGGSRKKNFEVLIETHCVEEGRGRPATINKHVVTGNYKNVTKRCNKVVHFKVEQHTKRVR